MTPHDTIEAELARVRAWARDQLDHGTDQPWSTFLLDRLHETIGALLAGMAATRAVDARQAPRSPAGRLEGALGRQDLGAASFASDA